MPMIYSEHPKFPLAAGPLIEEGSRQPTWNEGLSLAGGT